MKKFFGEFKEFISKGNVMDLAIGMVIGGMFTKIQAAKLTTRNKISTLIISGKEIGNLRRALQGEEIGTIFSAK